MNELAYKLLSKLLDAADKHNAGARAREATLTASNLKEYQSLSHKARLQCEESLIAAQSINSIKIIRDKYNSENGFIEKIALTDIGKLADFLGKKTLSSKVTVALDALEQHSIKYPVISEVLLKWQSANRVRGLGPDTIRDWLDAIKAINEAKQRLVNDASSLPIREFSARLFNDSKRIERLTTCADVLLADSIHTKPRDQNEVWQEIGLFREELPILLSGNVIVQRTKVTSYLDEPYAGFKADSVQSIKSEVQMILSIENLTTFHSEAKKRTKEDVLLIYTGGMPSPAWRRMYARLLKSVPSSAAVFHWGDIDEGGFRISYLLSKDASDNGHNLKPFNMSPLLFPASQRVDAQDSIVQKMIRYCNLAGWSELAFEIEEARVTVEQESL